MFAYVNLFFAILGILSGLPVAFPILNIVAAGFMFWLAKADAVDEGKHQARMAAYREQSAAQDVAKALARQAATFRGN